MRAAELEKFPGVRQFANGILCLAETAMKPTLQLRQRHVWSVPLIKKREGQAKFGPEFIQGHLRLRRLREDIVGRLPHGRQIIDQRARPIKDDISNHPPSLMDIRGFSHSGEESGLSMG